MTAQILHPLIAFYDYVGTGLLRAVHSSLEPSPNILLFLPLHQPAYWIEEVRLSYTISVPFDKIIGFKAVPAEERLSNVRNEGWLESQYQKPSISCTNDLGSIVQFKDAADKVHHVFVTDKPDEIAKRIEAKESKLSRFRLRSPHNSGGRTHWVPKSCL